MCEHCSEVNRENLRLHELLESDHRKRTQRARELVNCATCPRACFPSGLREGVCIDCWKAMAEIEVADLGDLE